jgi:PAS domain S-box-containing protein
LLIVGPMEGSHATEATGRKPTETSEAAPPLPAKEPVVAIEVAGETILPLDNIEDAADPPLNTVRFVFEMDRDGRFTFVSRELAETLGAENATLSGRRWVDIADAFGTTGDPVSTALAAGTRFSPILSWPVGDDEAVPVEFAADPVRAGDRSFAGYRGFGLILPDERHPQPNTKRLRLDIPTATPPAPPPTEEIVTEATPPEPEPIHEADDLDEVAQKSIEQGLRIRLAPREAQTRSGVEAPSNIVRLPGPQPARTAPERLTGTEREAFRRIAEALGTRDEDETLSAEPSAAQKKETPKTPAAEVDTRLLDRLPIGIAIFRDRKTLFANRTLLDLLGYDSADAFLAAGGAEAIFPGAQGLAGNIAEAGGKLAARRRDGETVPVTAWLHAVNFGGATALMLSLSVSRDRPGDSDDQLTLELTRIEARAEELEAILDTATDGVIVIDARGKIGNMNRAAEALFGIETSQFLGRYFTDLLADESQKAALDYLDGLASNGVASVLNDGREVIGRVPQGGLIPLFMTMGRIGTSDKFCAVLRDITHWKNVEEELIAARRAAEAANAQKSDFLAKISHEIRTPLNAIIGFSEVMMGERFGPIGNDRYRDYLHDINVSGAHLMSLINDLLDLSKIEAGKLDLSFEAVPVNATIQECVALMQPQANRERIIIRTSLSTNVPDVVADQRSFRQILLNLMSNAVKFTRAGGQVIVSTTLEETGEVVVRIRDTGIGMSEKDIQTALKPFRQVAIAKDDRDHGTGLGLPLTKALVEANRATFTIDSVVNQGTLVKVTFPTTRVLAG